MFQQNEIIEMLHEIENIVIWTSAGYFTINSLISLTYVIDENTYIGNIYENYFIEIYIT